VIEAFVSIANSLADGYDTVDLYAALTADCASLLEVASAALLLADDRGVLHLMAASSDRTWELDTFQLQREQGPCLDCFTSGVAVLIPDLTLERARWPQFVAAATAAGFSSVHALPMRLRDVLLGTLGLFGTKPGFLAEDDLAVAQALAQVASVALVADRAAADRDVINEQLQRALGSRIAVEQAKGLLAQLGDLDMKEAFAVLRRYARDHDVRLSDLATRLITRELPAQLVIDHGAH
jgi:transcriptional regulator with GAF, ATPase, and Fis domain